MVDKRPGRNDPCPCGSGKKYKRCCGHRDRAGSTDDGLVQPRGVYGEGVALLPPPRKTRQALPRMRAVTRVGVDYSFVEPFGEATVHYAFEIGRMVLLASGYVLPVEGLEPGMRFVLEDGQIATITEVEAPKVWQPPSDVPDQNGNFNGRVIGTIKRTGFMTMELVFGGEKVRTTSAHPFWSVNRNEWVDAGDLLPGERLRSEYGRTIAVDYIGPPQPGRIDLYNIEVEQFHTYFVGTAGNAAFVHNGVPGPEGCGIPLPAKVDGAEGEVRRLLYSRLPVEGNGGRWVGDPGNGTWISTDMRVRRAVAGPGGNVPESVSVVFRNGEPDFSPWVRTHGGVRGQTRITLDVDANASLRTRTDRDFAKADQWFADQLNKSTVSHPAGGTWTKANVKRWRTQNRLTWHHMNDKTTMQLVHRGLNDFVSHLGGRTLRDRDFVPPLPRRKPS